MSPQLDLPGSSISGKFQIRVDATTEHVLERDGYRLHYCLAGPQQRPLVVFIHGAGMDHRMFAAQVALLASDYRLLTWDVRGHGRSRPFDYTFSIPTAVADLTALLDDLGYQQVTLVGHSMGGYIAQEMVFRYPERVIALVVIGCTCLTLPHPAPIRSGMLLSPTLIRLCPYALLKWYAALTITVTPQVRAYVHQVLDGHTKEQFATVWSAVMHSIHPEDGYRITQPLLLTHGQHDNLGLGIIKRQAAAWAANDPCCRYVVIPAAAHNAHQENPAFFNPLLLDFLSRYVATGTDLKIG